MIKQRTPPRSKKGLLPWLRGNSPTIAITVVFIGALAGTLYILDRLYNEEKWELIQTKWNSYDYIHVNTDQYTSDYQHVLDAKFSWMKESAENAPARKKAGEELYQEVAEKTRRRFEELIDQSPVIVRLEIRDMNAEPLLVVEDMDKLRTQHDFSNSLLSRVFLRSAKQSYKYRIDGEEVTIGTWVVHVTTAQDDHEIELLTSKYWQIVLFTLSFLLLVYYALLKFTVTPIRRVIFFMERRDLRRTYLIPDPYNMLEKTFNNLARDAALTRLSKELRERITTQGLSYAQPILEQIPELLEDFLLISTAQIWTFHCDSNGNWNNDQHFQYQDAGPNLEVLKNHLLERLSRHDPNTDPQHWAEQLVDYKDHVYEAPYFCSILDQREEHLWLLLIHPDAKPPTPSPWWMDYFARIAHELRYALTSVEDQRRLILQEKSKANISLSRNLGHDLTNIIATSKLELITVKRLLGQGPEALAQSEPKKRIFEESLGALLSNTQFLQEIVNLYRSFSYLQKPKFEETDLGHLVTDVGNLYRLTLSSAFKIEVEVEGEIPPTWVEPRLLRLALFNLMTNSVDAIKRTGGEDKPEGVIHTTARHLKDQHFVEISVKDTGPGIRDDEGALLSADAISEIFRLGYTTKKNQEGEGLGLNWVQSIVREFHGGEVIARNREEGGAMFIMRIPDKRPDTGGPSSESAEQIPSIVGARD